MNEPRLLAAVAYESTQNMIYAIGGYDDKILDSCEYYDVKKDKWIQFSSLSDSI